MNKVSIVKGDIVIVTQNYNWSRYSGFRNIGGRLYEKEVWKKRKLSPGDKKIIKIGKVCRVNRLTYTVEMHGDCLGCEYVREFLVPKKDVRLSLEQTINRI